MKKLLTSAAVALSFIAAPMAAQATPADDLKAFQDYFKKRFPDVPFADFANGVYSVDKASREQWEAIEEFPPYEINIDAGETLWNTPFKNGKTYASCFGDDASAIKPKYPYVDDKAGVVTLEGAINKCRTDNGEKPLKWKKGKIADLGAYLAYQARGQKVNVATPSSPAAIAAYEKGKHHFYAKRGQLNLSCADCHVYSSGQRIRGDILSPALGHPTHFPVYRAKWGGLGTLDRRYGGCNKQVRAKPFKAQSDEYKGLELFHTYMSNGLEWNGPGARK
ncbi:MAG: sulfur oxidation c-type cytochrome SoxA [bacterium]